MDHQPDDGTEPVDTENTPDTGDLISPTAPDPRPEPVTDPSDPSYVEPAHAAVTVNPHNLLPALDTPKWPQDEVAAAEAALTEQIRRMTGRTDIRVVMDRAPLLSEPPAAQPSGTVGTSLPDAPDTTAESDPEGCA